MTSLTSSPVRIGIGHLGLSIVEKRCRASLSLPCIRKTAGENAQGLTGVRISKHLNVGDPFDPLEAAMAGGDEAERIAVLVREWLLAYMCRQER